MIPLCDSTKQGNVPAKHCSCCLEQSLTISRQQYDEVVHSSLNIPDRHCAGANRTTNNRTTNSPCNLKRGWRGNTNNGDLPLQGMDLQGSDFPSPYEERSVSSIRCAITTHLGVLHYLFHTSSELSLVLMFLLNTHRLITFPPFFPPSDIQNVEENTILVILSQK